MNRKSALTLTASILLSIMIITTAPFTYAVEWSPVTRLTTNEYVDWAPSITAMTDEGIWVVWHSDRDGNSEIYYKIFDGFAWFNDTRLTWRPDYYDCYPSVTEASDGKIWVVWVSEKTEPPEQNLYYKVFNGSTWSNDTQLTTDLYGNAYPSVMEDNDGKIWVAWTSTRTGDSEIFYKVFNGSTWSNDTQLTTDPNAQDWDPSIMQAADDKIWVAFTKTTNVKNKHIYYTIFDGSTWSDDTQLTFDDEDSESNPSIMQASDGTIWVVWHSLRNKNDENIFYKFFDGSTWSNDTQLTTDSSDDMYPSVAQDTDQTIWVAWGSWKGGLLPDIWYKINSHDVAITEVTVPVDVVIRGETISIDVTAMNRGTESETFDVKCHANSTLVGSDTISLTPGQDQLLTFQWNTTGFQCRTYIISATAVLPGEGKLYDNHLSGGSVEVRIPDFCGVYEVEPGVWKNQPIPDGRVDIYDFSTAIGQYGYADPDWHDPVYGPLADVNKDLVVDIDDLMMIVLHFGET